MANTKETRHDTKEYFSEDEARKAAVRLFDEAEAEGEAPKFADYIAESESGEHVGLRGRHKETPEDTRARQEKERLEYIDTTIRSTRNTSERRMLSTPGRGISESKGKKEGGGSEGLFGGISERTAIFVAVIALLMVVIVILIVNVNSLSSRLTAAEKDRDTFTARQDEYEQQKIKIDNLQNDYAKLNEENSVLRARVSTLESGSASASEAAAQAGDDLTSQGTEPVSGGDNNSGANGERRYTVVAGDTLTKIAEKQYGDSSKFTLIKEANNIVDDKTLQVGQVLIIP